MAIISISTKTIESLSLEKITFPNSTPKILGFHNGFQNEIEETLRVFGISNFTSSFDNSQLFSRDFSCNGLLFSSQYLNLLKNEKNLLLDRLIIEAGLIRNIPILFSQIQNSRFESFGINSLEYLKSNFDNVYSLKTSRQTLGKNPILASINDSTKTIYSDPTSSPILKWLDKVESTNQIKFNFN